MSTTNLNDGDRGGIKALLEAARKWMCAWEKRTLEGFTLKRKKQQRTVQFPVCYSIVKWGITPQPSHETLNQVHHTERTQGGRTHQWKKLKTDINSSKLTSEETFYYTTEDSKIFQGWKWTSCLVAQVQSPDAEGSTCLLKALMYCSSCAWHVGLIRATSLHPTWMWEKLVMSLLSQDSYPDR